MKAILFHASDDIFSDSLRFRAGGGYGEKQAIENFNDGKYEEVATFDIQNFDSSSLEYIYASSQNIDSDWRPDSPTRSTSVGDIVKVGEQLYIVASCGFQPL